MISWHKPGQKVVPVSNFSWIKAYSTLWQRFWRMDRSCGPGADEVCTISRVKHDVDGVWFGLREYDGFYIATAFRPVYPTIIDQLRKLDAPSPDLERVKEDEHV